MLRGLWTLFVLAVSTLALGIPATVFSLIRPQSNATLRLGRVWSRLLLRATGLRPVYEGLDHIPESGGHIFMANHQSVVDIWALVPILPDSTRFVAKRSLFRIPVMGWAMRASGFVPIDRQRLRRAIESLGVAGRMIRAGRSFVLFPEGTRSTDGELAPFKKGPFHLALRAPAPIVPVAISGTWDVVRPRSLSVRPGPVLVRVIPPIDVTPFLPDDVEGLRDTVRAAIAGGLESGEIDGNGSELRCATR